MKRLLLAAIAFTALVVPGSAANAHEEGYAGPGCDIDAVNDTTPGGQLGGENQWNGEISTLVIPTTAGVPSGDDVEVECELRINGNVVGTVLTAEGTGVAAGAGQVSFTAEDTDVITLCTIVTIIHSHPPDGPHAHTIVFCEDLTVTQIVPQPVVDAINLVIDTLNREVFEKIDPTICPIIALAAPGVPGVVDINSEGDIDLLTEPFWDCPPYDVEG